MKYVPEIGDTELGYRFLPEFWGMGLATEAGRASIEFARSDLGLKRLVAMVHPENVASATRADEARLRSRKAAALFGPAGHRRQPVCHGPASGNLRGKEQLITIGRALQGPDRIA